jgi:hypothetical protein
MCLGFDCLVDGKAKQILVNIVYLFFEKNKKYLNSPVYNN